MMFRQKAKGKEQREKDGKVLPLVFIVGPTGVGKSAVAMELAAMADGEIISCDAMQVYQEVQIATDKPSIDMRSKIPHHLVDGISLDKDFDVAQYRKLALAAIADVRARGRWPIVCGGSGMYMTALLDGLFEGGGPDPRVRQELEEELGSQGLEALCARLHRLDPEGASSIDLKNSRRVIRALEVCLTTGVPFSQKRLERNGIWGQEDVRIFMLDRPREELYARVEERIERMFEQGLVDEVRSVIGKDVSSTAAVIIGLSEVSRYLKGDLLLDEAKQMMKQNTRHYVKRQLTWFRRDERIEWVKVAEGQSALDVARIVLGKIQKRGNG